MESYGNLFSLGMFRDNILASLENVGFLIQKVKVVGKVVIHLVLSNKVWTFPMDLMKTQSNLHPDAI